MKLDINIQKSKIFLFIFILNLSIIIMSCQEQAPTDVLQDQILPKLSDAPYYSGTIRFTKLPTPSNPNNDFVVDITVNFKPDSNGKWPEFDVDPSYSSEKLEQINTVRVVWGMAGCYSDSTYLSGWLVPNKFLFGGTLSRSIIDTMISLNGEITRSYRLSIPSSTFSQYSQTSDLGDLYITLTVRFEGLKMPQEPSLNDILYRADYISLEHIEYNVVKESIFYTSVGSPQKQSFEIIP